MVQYFDSIGSESLPIFMQLMKYPYKSFEREFRRLHKSRQPNVYMLTFTLREMKDADSARAYIYRQHERPALEMVEYAVSEELTKKKMPHWHALIVCKKLLKKDRFNYYEKKFGFIDFSRNRHNNSDDVLKYISKENKPTVLMGLDHLT